MAGTGPYMDSNEPFNPIPGLMAGGTFGAIGGATVGWAGVGVYNNIDGGVKRLLRHKMKKDMDSFNLANNALNPASSTSSTTPALSTTSQQSRIGGSSPAALIGGPAEAKMHDGSVIHQSGPAQRQLPNSEIFYADSNGNVQSPFKEVHHMPVVSNPQQSSAPIKSQGTGTRELVPIMRQQETNKPIKDIAPPSALTSAELDRQALEDYKNKKFDSASKINERYDKLNNRSKITGWKKAGVIGGVALGAGLVGGVLGAVGNYD